MQFDYYSSILVQIRYHLVNFATFTIGRWSLASRFSFKGIAIFDRSSTKPREPSLFSTILPVVAALFTFLVGHAQGFAARFRRSNERVVRDAPCTGRARMLPTLLPKRLVELLDRLVDLRRTNVLLATGSGDLLDQFRRSLNVGHELRQHRSGFLRHFH